MLRHWKYRRTGRQSVGARVRVQAVSCSMSSLRGPDRKIGHELECTGFGATFRNQKAQVGACTRCASHSLVALELCKSVARCSCVQQGHDCKPSPVSLLAPKAQAQHVDEVVWCIMETVLWSLDEAALGRMRSRSSTVDIDR